jgi:uncharacterized protein
MFLDIKQLELHPLDFAEEYQPGAIDLGGEAKQHSPLKTSGHAEVVEEHHGKHQIIKDIRLRGGLATGLELQCARCLEPVHQDIQRDFELLYRPLGADAGKDELSVTDAEAEIGYYQGEGLLLEDVLREQVLLALPLKVTCREDCKGLCPECGKNLNDEQCSCSREVEDPRWAALKEVRSRLEQKSGS